MTKNTFGKTIMTAICTLLAVGAMTGCRTFTKQPLPPKPTFISHRGESSRAPENTLAAFRYAMEHDSDGFETDIHLTAGGTVVCCHDCSTKGVFGEDMLIEEHSLAELRRLKAIPHSEDYPDETIPTLAEALAVLRPGKLIYIELKHYDPSLVDAMVNDIRNSNVPTEQIVVISFASDAIKYCKENYPEYKTLWLAGFSYNEEAGKYDHDVYYYIDFLRSIHADGIDCAGDFDFMDEEFYSAFKKAGLEVMVWTIDNTDDARRFIQDGADGITSNRAVELIKELR